MTEDSSTLDGRKGPILRAARIGVGPSDATLEPLRELRSEFSSCGRPPALTEHGRDLAPAVEPAQPDLAAGDEAEEED